MKSISLDGIWKCKPDFNDNGIMDKWYDPRNYNDKDKDLLEIKIPNSFNVLEGFELFEGIFWHFRVFSIEDLSNDFDYMLYFKGINYNSKVWLNGVFLGENNGGFIPFSFFIRQKSVLKSKNNLLVIRIDNTRRRGQIPDYSFDWFNWGGIYRSIKLLILSRNRVKDVVIKTILKSRKESRIEVNYKIIGDVSVKWQILDGSLKSVLFEGNVPKDLKKGYFSLIIENPKLWSPDNPNLYYLKIYNVLSETKSDLLFESYFGIRQIEINGVNILLNKKKFYFKGISLHEEYFPYGRAIPYEKREEDIKNIKSLGFNALRTAHYSHDEDLIEIADRLGILILEEIPVYWFCDFKSNETFKLAAKMARSLIKRDINHPSVVWWSVGNEVPIQQPSCSRFFKRMMKWVKRFDDTRIITYVSHRLFCDLTRRHADVACLNAYFGWYYGSPKMINLVLDIVRTPVYHKPWIYTEFGAGAKFGFRAEWKKQIKFSEERQLYVLDYSIRTFNSKEYLAGWFLWAYRDFRSFLRQNKYQQGFNRKGIVSGERNEKKLIYYRIPQIINQEKPIKNRKLSAILIWIILFPIAYFITYIFDLFLSLTQKKIIDSGKEIEQKRLKLKKKVE
ncbi:MAG: glycoside hydrolase family 2 protein [Promethearchaeota archaeon]